MMQKWTLLLLATGWLSCALAQSDTLTEDKAYYLSQLLVKGTHYSSPAAVRQIAGLEPGWIVLTGPAVPDALKRLWREKIFQDLQVDYQWQGGDTVQLELTVNESFRLGNYQFMGLNRSQEEALTERLNLIRGTYFTPAQELSVKRMIRNYFVEKGYYHMTVDIQTEPDPLLEKGLNLTIVVDKKQKTHLSAIEIQGNEQLSEQALQKAMKPMQEHHWWKVWAPGKYQPQTHEQALQQVLQTYQEAGLQDAKLLSDSLIVQPDGHLKLVLTVSEGKPYYLRSLRWTGNQLYTSEELDQVLGLSSGSLYRPGELQQRLYGGPQGLDIATLYLERGHLFFQAQPVISAVEGDSLDIEIRIQEGLPAWIRSVNLLGNTKTADHVILRELDTKPGDSFSRTAIMRSQRKLMALNYFAPEGFDVVPQSDPKTGAVDLVYALEEQSTDKFQLSGGWSPRIYDSENNQIGGGLTGTVQLVFNNFSTRRFLDRSAWHPVPSGDGQQLSLAVQSNGGTYTNFAASYQEPWLGGKKPNFFGLSTRYELYRAQYADSEAATDPFSSRTFSVSADYGTRFAADDFTRYYVSLGYRRYNIENPGNFYPVFEEVSTAKVNAITLKQELRRNNLDNPNFPTQGMDFSLSLTLTPPYSLFQKDRDFEAESPADTYRWLEYHKWQAKGDIYQPLGTTKLVLRLHGEMGYVGAYQDQQGISPFERFSMGGYGLLASGGSGFMGTDMVPLRGYDAQAFNNSDENFPLYHRYAVELRYPIALGGQFPVWLLGFAEAGNAYTSFKRFDPIDLKRSAGLGFRTQIPMIGLFGLDWGYGFDAPEGAVEPSGHQFHIILGREF